ncbi:MAG: ABC transporter ATP-binding protein [bacterium]|nr:ABC transporter ATP-binding protein [bacterium]
MTSDRTDSIRLRLTGITKHFPGVTANAGISLDVRRGEILAILGENGAGKSTLMSIVSGMLDPDEGSIEVDGRPARIRKPADAQDLGIGMVYQHFALAPTLTVAENLALSSIGSKGIFANIGGISTRVREMSEAYHLDVDPDALVEDLSVGARQRVEIIKLLYGGAEILILDEPTSVLTPLEWEHLVRILQNLAGQGHSIILITHKLDELMGIADRCTVLRQGHVVGTVNVADTDKAELARMTIGRDVMFDVQVTERERGPVALVAEDISLVSEDGRLALDGISLKVRAGEILGIAGVDGNGQQELAEVLTGLRAPTSGRLGYGDDWFTVMSPLDFYRLGGSAIPADRHHTALALELSIRDNLVMKELALGRMQRWGVINDPAVDQFCSDLIGEYDIRTPGSRVKMRHLSGGNQQKAVLARELCRRPPLLIASQPTRGLDVGATETVLSRMQAERERGCAIVLFSTEIEEILLLSDRVAVMVDGRFLATLDRNEATYARLGLLMGGEAIEEEDKAMLEAVER